MKILFIGGTGTISSACAQLALERGFELTLLNRGRQPAWPGARQIKADINDVTTTAAALGSERWDAVVDYIAFTPAEMEQRITLFRGRTAQFIFISSASAYQKPPGQFSHHRIHAAGESVLGLFAQQDRLRRTAAARVAERNIFP